MIADILVTGLVNSGVYALLALGFALVFGVARIVNIAHTAFYMLAAYAFYWLLVKFELPAAFSGLVAIGGTIALALASYRVVIEPVRAHDSAVLIATVALGLIFQELMLLSFGGSYLGVPSTVQGVVQVWGVSVPYQRLLILAAAAAALAITWFVLYRTRVGLAIRATANDLEMAELMGMNVRRAAMVVIALSAGLAAVAGVAVAPVTVVSPLMWLPPLIVILTVVVLGGMGSIKGAMLGAFIVGYVEAITVFVMPAGSYLKGAVVLIIMVAVLLIRPEGLLGTAFEEER